MDTPTIKKTIILQILLRLKSPKSRDNPVASNRFKDGVPTVIVIEQIRINIRLLVFSKLV